MKAAGRGAGVRLTREIKVGRRRLKAQGTTAEDISDLAFVLGDDSSFEVLSPLRPGAGLLGSRCERDWHVVLDVVMGLLHLTEEDKERL
jgi:hypothetical protein